MQIPHQVNEGGVVAVLPSGKVEFLDHAVLPLIAAFNRDNSAVPPAAFHRYINDSPRVRLNGFHLAAPAIVFVEITNRCNLRCKHCYVSSGVARPNEMPTEMILRTLDDLAKMGVLQVFLTGGELFSHRDAVKIINHAQTKPFITQLVTNGTLITEDKLAQIAPGTSFFISFDTADPERTIRGGMDFPLLRERFDWMAKYGHILRTLVSVHRNNVQDIPAIYEWCIAHGYPRPQWLETHPMGRALLNPDIFLQIAQIEEVWDVYTHCMDLYARSPVEAPAPVPAGDAGSGGMQSVDTIHFCLRLEHAAGQEKCARSIAYINASGEVYPCSNCQSASLYKGGSLREQSFHEIWENGFDAFRAITYDQFTVCRGCPVDEAGVWCQFRCPPLSINVAKSPVGCGASDYHKLFMVRAHRYWEERERQGIEIGLAPPR